MKVMKKLFLAVMIAAFLVGALPVHAVQPWSGEYCRITDYPSALSEAERDNIDENCVRVVSTYLMDVAGLILTAADYQGMTLREAGDAAYEKAGFGCGPDRDGIMIVYDTESGQMCINCYGAARDYFTESYLQLVITDACGQLEKRGVWGVMLYPVLCIEKSLAQLTERGIYQPDSAASPTESAADTSEAPAVPTTGSASDPAAETPSVGDELPNWYPADTDRFVPFHNDAAPRVVDEADIFTPEEETVMKERIRALWELHQTDIVIWTSKKGYGLEKEALASDFFDYGGYGYGDDYDGVCLLFVMDPESRGFRVSVNGERMRALYTETAARFMDDCLYEYVRSKKTEGGETIAGDYGRGVIEWLGQMETLCTYGYPTVPDWYTGADIKPFHNPSAPRVTSEIEALEPEQLQHLTDKCHEIAEKTGYDVAIHVTGDTCQLSMKGYAELFFRHQGYGLGDTYDGMLLLLRHDESREDPAAYIYINGNRPDALTDVNEERMRDHVTLKYSFSSSSPYGPAKRWLKDMAHMADTGRIMPFAVYWILITAGGLFVSFFAVLIWSIIEENRMKKPKIRDSAAEYAVPGSLRVIAVGDHLLRMRKDRKYSPVTKASDSRSASSSNSNHYNDDYKSSSGRTHTTSGRDF